MGYTKECLDDIAVEETCILQKLSGEEQHKYKMVKENLFTENHRGDHKRFLGVVTSAAARVTYAKKSLTPGVYEAARDEAAKMVRELLTHFNDV